MGQDDTDKLDILLQAIDHVSSRACDEPINDPSTNRASYFKANGFSPMLSNSDNTSRYGSQTPKGQPVVPRVDDKARSTKNAQHRERESHLCPRTRIRKATVKTSQHTGEKPRSKTPGRVSRKFQSAREANVRRVIGGDRSVDVQSSSRKVTRSKLGELKFEPTMAFNKYACSECNYRFFDRTVLSRHIKSMHEESDRKWECVDCSAKFRNRSNLLRHAVVHNVKPETGQTDENGHKCTVCSAWFKTRRGLTNHVRSHDTHPEMTKPKTRRKRNGGEVSFLCNIDGCSYANTQRCNIERHFEIVHLGLKPYICSEPDCDYKGSTNANLQTHITRRHKKKGSCMKPEKRAKEEMRRDCL